MQSAWLSFTIHHRHTRDHCRHAVREEISIDSVKDRRAAFSGRTYWHSLGGTSMVEKISAVTLRVANMRASVRFYKDVLGLEIIYGGEGSYFTSLRTKDGDTILNLEHGNAGIRWGRLIFHVSDVDRFWAYLMEKGFHPDSPQDASWGERYFHMPDPDGHELSFARLI
jgi:catechol 2,3-dioxygenase-like lactoylglutathione lyase family enzyme